MATSVSRRILVAILATVVATGCGPDERRNAGDTAAGGARAHGDANGDVAALVYVSNEDSDDITIIDSRTDSVIGSIPAGKRPRGLALSPDGRTLFVAVSGSPKAGPGVDESKLPPPDRAADGVAVIDLATHRYSRTLPGGQDPESFAISKDGRTLYVSNEDAASVSVVDVQSSRVIATVPVGGEPEGVTLHPDGRSVYVTSEADHGVDVIDTERNTVIARIPTGNRPRSTVFTADGAKGYVTAELGGAVTLVDAKAHKPLRSIAIPGEGAKPMGTAISPDGRRVYVTNGRGGTLSVIDVATDSVVATVKVGTRPWGVGVTPDGKKIYTANGPSNDVSVIDAETRQVIATVKGGRSPWGVAVARGPVPLDPAPAAP
jgi:YVTN family beta-propeller protein